MTELYNIDGELLTEDQVLERIRHARERRAEIEQQLEHQEKQRWYRDRCRMIHYGGQCLDWATEGYAPQEQLRDVIVGLTGILMTGKITEE